MEKEKQEIRNLDGKLVCEAAYTEEHGWEITIGDHGCYTLLYLYPDGEMVHMGVTNRIL